jgi:hypothetical protein
MLKNPIEPILGKRIAVNVPWFRSLEAPNPGFRLPDESFIFARCTCELHLALRSKIFDDNIPAAIGKLYRDRKR